MATSYHSIGSYYDQFFNNADYFALITQQHTFQNLTESNKQGVAYRKGLYISEVTDDGDFHLLRCSTNFNGPTEGFTSVDRQILNQINPLCRLWGLAEVNHVLAQVYINNPEQNKKAKIKEHSDKTKDMPSNGCIAFCTFYDSPVDDPRKLTTLRFKSKETGEKVNLQLGSNSLFLMPLSSNRLWTHEIVPSQLPIEQLPTRLGYVCRCSKTEAIHEDGKTYIIHEHVEDEDGDGYIIRQALHKPTDLERLKLKTLYAKEIATTEVIDYGDIDFSLNDGDYLPPIKSPGESV